MKKLIVGILLLAPLSVSALTIDPPANGDPNLVMQPWGLTMEQTRNQGLIFPSGTTRTLKNGTSYTCPWWFPAGCVDTSWVK